jgi:rSAM/selenodomain-associated transferase 2
MIATPELSIIVPVLNEEETLPPLFRNLAEQEGVRLELFVCDGGSSDDSVSVARRLQLQAPFPLTLLEVETGRGRQLNSGAFAGRGETLLFLHADSRFRDRRALRSALDLLHREIDSRGTNRVAGHFPLRFDRCGAPPSLPYYFYECKARLGRRECSHGDQGIMLRRSYFAEAGPFDESLPMLSETRLAEALRQGAGWLLFHAEIFTSPRRFDSEGLYERQVLNAIIMNFAAQGWEAFFRELPAIYAGHGRCGPIPLADVLERINLLISSLPLRRRLALWLATGAYVRSHAWQVPFFLDTRRNFRRGLPPGKGETPLLAIHDRCLDRLTDAPPGRLAAALLTWIWFRLTRMRLLPRP